MQKLITVYLAVILFESCSESEVKYPKRDVNRLYTTDTTFYIMDGKDTLSKLLNERTLELAE